MSSLDLAVDSMLGPGGGGRVLVPWDLALCAADLACRLAASLLDFDG